MGYGMKIDLKIAQLMSSRICHDLASAAVAINAGSELVAEEGGHSSDAADLMMTGAGLLSNRLNFFRAAFGPTSLKTMADTRRIAEMYLLDGKSRLKWPDSDTVSEQDEISGFDSRIMLQLILLASETLLRGGDVTVNFAVLSEGYGFAVAATGETVKIRDEIRYILDADVDGDAIIESVTARNIHGYYLLCLLRELGAKLETAGTDTHFQFAVLVPHS